MTTMNISLPDSLKEFVDHQVTAAGYGTSSEYVREPIRRDQDRLRLRGIPLEGAQSMPTGLADTGYFDSLRSGIKKRLPASPCASIRCADCLLTPLQVRSHSSPP